MLGVALLLCPYLLEFFTQDPRQHSMLPWYLLASPLVLTTSDHDAIAVAEGFVIIWLIVSGAAAVPWLVGQWLRFAPYRAEEGASSK